MTKKEPSGTKESGPSRCADELAKRGQTSAVCEPDQPTTDERQQPASSLPNGAQSIETTAPCEDLWPFVGIIVDEDDQVRKVDPSSSFTFPKDNESGQAPFSEWPNYKDEGPNYKDQVRTVKPPTSAQPNLGPRVDVPDDEGPNYKDQVRPVEPPTSAQKHLASNPDVGALRNKDQARTVRVPPSTRTPPSQRLRSARPGAVRVPREQSSDSSVSESSIQQGASISTRDTPSLINAVLVESTLVQADPVAAENKRRRRLLVTILVLLGVAIGIAVGVPVASVGGPGPNGPSPVDSSTQELVNATLSPSCFLDFNLECFISGDYLLAGLPCMNYTKPLMGIEPCMYPPIRVRMLYNGGGCEQSGKNESENYSCIDLNGGPPADEGEVSHIVVTYDDVGGRVLFEGDVSVGELYTLYNDEVELEGHVRITIHSQNQTEVLQSVRFLLRCSTERGLELMNRFGASQVVEIYNYNQGYISAFSWFSFEEEVQFVLSIIITVADRIVTLNTLVAETSFIDGSVDLTDQVAGTDIHAGATNTFIFEGEIYMYQRQRYTMLYAFETTINPGGEFCNGTAMNSFVA